MRKTLACCLFLLGSTLAAPAAAHSLTIEEGFESRGGDDYRPWQIVTTHFNVAPADMGFPGALFIGATTEEGKTLVMTSRGWEPFAGGMSEPALVVPSMSGYHQMKVFDSRANPPPRFNYGLPGDTLCEAARMLRARRFTVAIGYGVLTVEAQKTVNKAQELGVDLDADWIRLAHVHGDMMSNAKWQQVYSVDCPDTSGGS